MVCAAARAPWVPEFVRGVYRANFGEDRIRSNDFDYPGTEKFELPDFCQED